MNYLFLISRSKENRPEISLSYIFQPLCLRFCSFALILYEIHGRRGPYGDSHGFKTHEILNLVSSQIFRPPLDDLENCMDFVKVCLKESWNEDPALRPDFKVFLHSRNSITNLKANRYGL